MPTSKAKAKYRFGDVVVVPFPYSDRHAEKRRPALVVSNERVAKSGYIWLVMITSARGRTTADDLPIDKLAATGLTSPSVVRPAKIVCLEPARVVRISGRIQPELAERVVAILRSYVGKREPA